VLPVLKVTSGPEVQQVPRVTPVLPGLSVQRGLKEPKDLKVIKVSKDPRATPVLPVQRLQVAIT
jgi:hypothetical protein